MANGTKMVINRDWVPGYDKPCLNQWYQCKCRDDWYKIVIQIETNKIMEVRDND